MQLFSHRLILWQKQHGRLHLPWQSTNPYQVWLSEIMLQQTQVNTVIPYYHRFLDRFPDVQSLAAASLDEVLSYWSGLGYYSRARNLHFAAQMVMETYQGQFPTTQAMLITLPGIGRSTAAAIAAFAFGERTAILDGNVKRVLTRHQGIFGITQNKKVEESLWRIAESLLPEKTEYMVAYTQGMMDLGSLICSRSKPLCPLCPVQQDCYAFKHHAQALLPSKKPKKILPTRETVMLLIQDREGRILLQQRPSTGVWPGLWSLPEVATTLEAETYCRDILNLSLVELSPPLPEFVHTFTHYRLTITPQPIKILSALSPSVPDRQWVTLTQAFNLGLPAPVRKLLSTLE
jgi:A/G-specific adenine glycosylase